MVKRQSLMHVVVPEAELHTDLEIHDRFCSFSAELARLALLSLGGVAWLVGSDLERRALLTSMGIWPLAVGIGLVCVSVLASLLHRFWACDAMACQVRARRLVKAIADGSREPDELHAEEAAVRWRLRASARALYVAWTTMALGAICIGATLITALMA